MVRIMHTRFAHLMPTVAAVLLGGCTLLTSPRLDQSFELAPGQSVAIAATDLIVTFREVVSDSRCPATAVCVWAGNGEVELAVRRGGTGDIAHILGTPSGPLEVVVGEYRIRVLGLDPYPLGTPIPEEDYRLRLSVSEK